MNHLRGYFVFLRFAATSLLTAALDNLMFFLAYSISGSIGSSQIIGRVVACVFNYWINKKGVFHSRAHNTTALPKYILNVIVAGILAYIGIRILIASLHMNVMAAKLTAETAIFFFNFAVQRAFVFASPQQAGGEE